MVGSKVWGRGLCGVTAKEGGPVRGGGQGGCEPRIELIVNMKKSRGGWSGWFTEVIML